MTSQQMPPAFTRLMVARALFSLATQIQSVALGWQMYQLTKSPLLIGFIGLAEAIPAIGLSLYAGAVVDRGSPNQIFRQLLQIALFSTVVMALSQIEVLGAPQFFIFGVSGAVHGLFAASFTAGIARAFAQPSIYALVPQLIPREQLSTASAWAATWLQIARVSGPALGGVLMASCGVYGCAGVIVCALFFAIATTIRVSALLPTIKPAETISRDRRGELLSGLRFVWRHPLMLPALSIDMVCVLFGGVTALLPIYAEEILGVGATGLGALRAAPALGAATMGFFLTRFDLRAHAGRYFLCAVAGFGCSILIFSVSTSFVVSLAALALSGAFDSVSVVVRSSIVQLSSPDDMRGRISAVNYIFIGSSNEIGEVESGVLAHYIGVVPTAVFGGLACLGILGMSAICAPTLRRLNLRELESRVTNVEATT